MNYLIPLAAGAFAGTIYFIVWRRKHLRLKKEMAMCLSPTLSNIESVVCNELGANVFGRLEYAARLMRERKYTEARMELEGVLVFLPDRLR